MLILAAELDTERALRASQALQCYCPQGCAPGHARSVPEVCHGTRFHVHASHSTHLQLPLHRPRLALSENSALSCAQPLENLISIGSANEFGPYRTCRHPETLDRALAPVFERIVPVVLDMEREPRQALLQLLGYMLPTLPEQVGCHDEMRLALRADSIKTLQASSTHYHVYSLLGMDGSQTLY